MQSKLQNNFANEDLTQPPNEATKGDDTHPSICVTAGYVWPDLLFESRRPSIASAIEYDDKENVNSAQEKRDKGMRTEADVSNSPCKSADLSIYVNVKELALDRYVQAFSAVEENRHEVCSEEPFKNTTQALDHTSDFQGLTMQDCLQREAKTAETGMKATGQEMLAEVFESELEMNQPEESSLKIWKTHAGDVKMEYDREEMQVGEAEVELV